MLVFSVSAYPWKAFLAITAVTIALPLVVIALMLAYAQALPSWLFILAVASAIGFLLSINAGLTALVVYIATRNEITIRDGTMHLKGGEFHERVPLDSIVHAEVVDLRTQRELAGARRRNGVVLPGFRVGWFQTADERWLFVLRAARRQLLYVQTKKGFSVLLGVEDPHALRRRLLSPETATAR